MAITGLLLSDDLLFASRIIGAARDLGLTLVVFRDVSALRQSAAAEPPACVILDLQVAGPALAELMGQLHGIMPRPTVVGYGSHVDAATLRAARDAGCDVVLPRSKFVEELPTALAAWFGVRPSA